MDNSSNNLSTCTKASVSVHSENQTSVHEFVLLGLTDISELQKILFAIFLIFYNVTLSGNLSILVVTQLDPNLHTPMYFFLRNLSICDIGFSSTAVPKMLVDFLSLEKTISFGGCFSQMHFFHFFGGSEVIIVTVMSYDRYVAIVNPLHYPIIMNTKLCFSLTLGSWLIGFLHSLLHTLLAVKLPYCGPNQVNHFFCDIKPVLKLACTDTSSNLRLLNTLTGYLIAMALLLTFLPYVLISQLLLKKHMTEGTKRAFSTCSAHLTVVILMYGTAMFTYSRPTAQDSLIKDKAAALLFTVITPALNPFIYTLRNKGMKQAMKRIVKRYFRI